MKALLCKQYGPPESLVLEDVPRPAPPGDGPGSPSGARVRGELSRSPPHREQVPGASVPSVLAGRGGRGGRRRGGAGGRERDPRGRPGNRDDRLARIPRGDAGRRRPVRPAPRLDGLRDRRRLHPDVRHELPRPGRPRPHRPGGDASRARRDRRGRHRRPRHRAQPRRPRDRGPGGTTRSWRRSARSTAFATR